jgi:hypothetical protein
MSRVPRHGEQCRTAEHPEPPTLAEARGGYIDHGLDQLGECGSLGHVAGGAEEKDFHNRTSSLITRATRRSRLGQSECCSSDCRGPCVDGNRQADAGDRVR